MYYVYGDVYLIGLFHCCTYMVVKRNVHDKLLNICNVLYNDGDDELINPTQTCNGKILKFSVYIIVLES